MLQRSIKWIEKNPKQEGTSAPEEHYMNRKIQNKRMEHMLRRSIMLIA
jgi:hypothetical protein